MTNDQRARIIRVLQKQLYRTDRHRAKGSWREAIKKRIFELKNQSR